MALNNTPNIDPANNGTLVGTINFAFQQMIKNVDGMLPAQVISYDRNENRVTVQMLITLVTTSGAQVPRPTVSSLPVLVLGGGGFQLSFPINPGDMGWVLASDRDISLFLQNYTQTQPNTRRIKNFSDGLFIPDAMKTVQDITDGYVTLTSTDGKASVSMGVNLGGGTEVNIVGDRVNIGLNNTTTGLMTINGNLDVSGVITSPVAVVTAPIIPFPPVYPP